MQVFGPAPAPLSMLRGRHRQRLLVHARRALDVQDVIREWRGRCSSRAVCAWRWMWTPIPFYEGGGANFGCDCLKWGEQRLLLTPMILTSFDNNGSS